MKRNRKNPPRAVEEMDFRLSRLERAFDFFSMSGGAPPLFLARKGATDLQWQERTVVTISGTPTVLDYDDGRKCTSDTATEHVIDTQDSIVLLEVFEGNAARYIKIRDISAGQYFGMVLYTDAQNAQAWGYLPVVNIPPV